MAPYSSNSFLLPVLVLLSLTLETRSFSHKALGLRMKRSSTPLSLTRPYKHRPITSTRHRRLGNTICWATMEPPFLSATTNEENEANNDTNNAISELPHQQYNNNTNNNHNQQQQPQQQSGRKGNRRSNAAMADPAFLRKRTERLLSISSMAPAAADEPTTISSKGMKVDRKTFHFLIDAWAFSGEVDAAEKANALLQKMEELDASQQQQAAAAADDPQAIIATNKIQPDVRSYTKVINAIARAAKPHSGQMAEAILEKMVELHQSGRNLRAKPNTFTYTAVVEAHTNSGITGSAQSAEAICELMVQKFTEEQDPDVRPNARSFNAAINAYAKSGDIGAAERADYLFRRMEDVYQSTGLEEIKPNSYNYNSLISAWANCGEEGAAERAEGVLQRMEALYKSGDSEVTPTTVSYNAVIDAYSKCVQEEDSTAAGERAENILYHMEELYKSGENMNAKPNVRSYNTVINVWAKSRSMEGPRRAEDILGLIKNMVAQGDVSIQPDVHSFSTVINAWARSNEQNKAERSLNLLKEMKQLSKEGIKNVRPNVVAANAVMNACAYTTGDIPERNRAMEIAHKVFKEMEAGEIGKPDQVTYGTFLQVCTNQMPECSTRDQIVEMIFQKCKRDGQVGNLVLQQLRTTTSPAKYIELIGMHIESIHGMEDLPEDWWCNVVEGKWRRRRNFESEN